MPQIFIIIGALFSLIGVTARSLSSHPIHQFLTERGKLENFNIGADYLLFHGIALIAIAILVHLFPEAKYDRAGYCLIAGSVLFQFSVLIKACVSIQPFGFITPIGGFILMLGWGLVALSAFQSLGNK